MRFQTGKRAFITRYTWKDTERGPSLLSFLICHRRSRITSFIVEYFDPLPQIKKKYLLKYFVDSHSVEMIDIQKKKLFLKKSPCPPEVSASDFFIGGRVFLYSRELVIVEYGDGSTRRRLHKANTKCMAVVSSDVYQDWGVIISALEKEMTLVRLRTVIFSDQDVDTLMSSLQIDQRNRPSLMRGTNLSFPFKQRTDVK